MAAYRTSTDQELLALIKQGDYVAFTEIYTRHADALYGSAYNILRDRAGCKDIIQDVFIWFWQHREQWQLTSCKGYLLTAVKFKTANYIRDNKIHKGFFAELADLEIGGDDEEAAMEARQLSDFIRAIADQLPGKYGEIFRLSRYAQLSNKEIGLKMNISEKTVENQMTIALKKLKEKLGTSGALLFFFL